MSTDGGEHRIGEFDPNGSALVLVYQSVSFKPGCSSCTNACVMLFCFQWRSCNEPVEILC